jgi:hypothetical protein
MSYFNYCTGLTMTNERFHDLFEGPPRRSESLLTQRDMDLAASVQVALEQIVLRLTRALADETGMENLCLAGGVALNCVANGKILRDGRFKSIWIQPAAGDAGGALGAALAVSAPARQAAARFGERGPRRHERVLPRPGVRPGTTSSGAFALPAQYSRWFRTTTWSSAAPPCSPAAPRSVGSGTHGVRAPRARRALDPRRCTFADHAVAPQPEGEVSRVVPPVRAVGAARGRRRLVRARRDSPTCCWSPMSWSAAQR